MAYELRAFAVTIPAGTAQATPQTTDMSFPARIVRQVDVRVPPGPNGEVGWHLANSGQQMWPFNVGQWLITDNEVVSIPMTGAIDSGSWQFVGYNTGNYPHTLDVRFYLDLPAAFTAPPAAAPLIPLTALSSQPGG
jgi:hypothetical protein